MRRLYLTRREYDRLLARQDGMCCVPWCRNSELIAAFSKPRAFWPRKPDRLMCAACQRSTSRRHQKVKTGRNTLATWSR